MRVNLWIVDRMDDTVIASFEKISLRRAAWIERKWRRRRVRLTEVIVFSDQCTPPRTEGYDGVQVLPVASAKSDTIQSSPGE